MERLRAEFRNEGEDQKIGQTINEFMAKYRLDPKSFKY